MNHTGKKKEIKPCETLFITNIPPNSCTVPTLFQHFKNYGYIQSIYASGTCASITFNSIEEAKKAFYSPEAFVNNRFVRYFYHNNPSKALDKLSQVVDKNHVQSVLKQVNDDLEQQKRNTIELQNQLKSSQHLESSNNSQTDLQNNSQVDDIITYKPQILEKLKELRNEMKTATPERKEEIRHEIEENENVIKSIDSLMIES